MEQATFSEKIQIMIKTLSRFLISLALAMTFVACSSGSGTVRAKDVGTLVDCTSTPPGKHLADNYVCAHNAHRKKLPAGQPVPSPALPAVIWNQALSDWAKSHVKKCVFEHSDGNARKAKFGQPIGENLHASTNPAVTPEDAIRSWVEEAQYYNYNTNTCTGGVCGHYTQVIWRNSVEIGCAITTCENLANTEFTNAKVISCNYKPAGNYIGQKPY